MEKSVKIKVNGVEIELKGFSLKAFKYYCDYGVVEENIHEVGDDFKLCEVRTSAGIRTAVVCNKCFEKIKNEDFFIREVLYEIQSVK